ncbi:MAG: Spy/CpxP family protein refolding chaperone [Panacagrimonas sp.]
MSTPPPYPQSAHPTRLSIIALFFAVALSACASAPATYRPGSFDGISEKAALFALREIQATDDQRAKFLAAYDRHNPELVALANQRVAITDQWNGLNRTDEAFLSQVAGLSERAAAVTQQQWLEQASFEHDIAAVLTPEQWRDWRALWVRLAEASEYAGGDRHGSRR